MISGQSQGDRPRSSRSLLTLKKTRNKSEGTRKQANSKIYCVNTGPDFTDLLFRRYDCDEDLLRHYSKVNCQEAKGGGKASAASGALPSTP